MTQQRPSLPEERVPLLHQTSAHDRAVLTVFDGGYPGGMVFDAIIGTPPTLRVAHHRRARGHYRLLAEDETCGEGSWETRTYVHEGDGRYEPQGWQTITDEEIVRRGCMATRRPHWTTLLAEQAGLS
jgi:hypothetical protein